MRKFNAVISILILGLFVIHAIAGSFQLSSVINGGSTVMKILSKTMVMLVVIHMVIGTKLTFDSIAVQKKTRTAYFKENRLFWLRRISGFAVMLFLVFHVIIFVGNYDSGVYRLNLFGEMQLVSQILFVLSLLMHIIANIKPLMMALGAVKYKNFMIDIMVVLSVILMFAAVAFILYYLRWLF